MTTQESIEAYAEKFRVERGDKAARRVLRFLKPWAEYHPSGPVTPAMLDDFALSLRKQGLAASSANRVIGTVKAFLRWQRKREDIGLDRDDLDDWKQYKVDKPQPRVLKPDEINALLATAATTTHRSAQRWRVYTILGLTLGCRHSELCALSAANVDLAAREVRIWGTKTGVERRIPFHESPSTARLLERLCDVLTDRPFIKALWVGSWHELGRQAKIESVPRKVLRSTCAAYVASGSQSNEYLLSARFGHTTDVAVRHYREPINGLQGTTIEEWMGAVEGFKLATDAACSYVYRK